MDIGKALKYCRLENEKSVYQIEKDIGISHSQIYRWESNKVIPSIMQCIMLADYYETTLDELLGREIGQKATKITTKYYKCKF